MLKMLRSFHLLNAFALSQYQYWPQYAAPHEVYSPEYQVIYRRPQPRQAMPPGMIESFPSTAYTPEAASQKVNEEANQAQLSRRVNDILNRSIFNLKKSEVNAGNLMLNDRSREALNEAVQAVDNLPGSATGSLYQRIDGVADPTRAGVIPEVIANYLPLPGFARDLPAANKEDIPVKETSLIGRVIEHQKETRADTLHETAGRLTQTKKRLL